MVKSHGNKSYKNKIDKWRGRHQLEVMGDKCSEFLGLCSGFLCFLPKSSRNFWNLHGFHSAQFENQYPRANFSSQKKPSSEVELFAPRTLVMASSTTVIRKEMIGKYACIVALVSEDALLLQHGHSCSLAPRCVQTKGFSQCCSRVTLHPWHLCGQLTSAISISSTVDILHDIKEEM